MRRFIEHHELARDSRFVRQQNALATALSLAPISAGDGEAPGGDGWIRNDLSRAYATATASNRPVLVLFR